MKNLIYSTIFFLLCFISINLTIFGQSTNIKNDVFWNTKDGKPIYSQGGGVFRFADPTTGV